MEQQSEELYSMLVPLHQHRLIVPRACVAEVVRYIPGEAVAGEPDWLRGRLAWNDLELPLISFEELAGLPVTERTCSQRFGGLLHGTPKRPVVVVYDIFVRLGESQATPIKTDPLGKPTCLRDFIRLVLRDLVRDVFGFQFD